MSVPAYLLVPHDRTAPGPGGARDPRSRPGQVARLRRARRGSPTKARRTRTRSRRGLRRARARPARLRRARRLDARRQVPLRLGSRVRHDGRRRAARAQPLGSAARRSTCSPRIRSSIPTRIGAAGLSYGGTCTLFLAALDERVRAAVVSGYLSSWRSAHTDPVEHVRLAGDARPARRDRARRHRGARSRPARCSSRPAPRTSSSRSPPRARRSRRCARSTRSSARPTTRSCTTCSTAATCGTAPRRRPSSERWLVSRSTTGSPSSV